MAEPTLFEKIASGEIPAEIVYENEHCFAFRDIEPQAPHHVLIVPRKPIPRVMEADQGDREVLGELMLASQKVAEVLGVDDPVKGYRLVVNNGADAGEAVPHLHMHLLAGRKMDWPPG